MPRAIPAALRQEVVRRREAGESSPLIAAALGLQVRTVRALWQRYRTGGAPALALGYARCGRRGPRFPPAVVAAALALKQTHPSWGAGLARLELAQALPDQRLPSARTLERWWRGAGLSVARTRHPPVFHGRGQRAHEVWQLDAKERHPVGRRHRTERADRGRRSDRGGAGGGRFPPWRGGRA